MVAVFLAAHAVVALRVYASGALFSTVGVYDEPTQTNSVDFIAEGSTLALSQFKSDIETAFNNDFGGVNQCYAISGYAGPYPFSYGVNQTKCLNMTGPTNNEIGITASSSFVQSISEGGVWVSIRSGMTFYLADVSSRVAGEAVVKFGLTILSSSVGVLNPGTVTATATFSGGSKASASRFISERAGLGDTFFGFAAPSGQSILSVTFTNDAPETPLGFSRGMIFDDIGFITAVVPSLTISKEGSSRVRLSWPTNATAFSLEFTTSFPGQMWTTDTNAPTVIDDRFTVSVDSGVGQRFYRIRGP